MKQQPTPAPTPTPKDPVLAELQKLQQEQNTQMQALSQAYQKAKTDEERNKIVTEGLGKMSKTLLPRYEALEKKSKGATRLQVRMAMLGVVRQGSGATDTNKLLTRMVKEDRDLPQASMIAMQIRYMAYEGPSGEKNAKTLLAELGKSKTPKVRAAALYATAEMIGEKNPKEGATLLKRLMAEYPKTDSALQAKTALFEMENLAIGMVAPEITGTDHEGKPFQLSEYRGKVVVLDFWGFW